MIFDDLNKGTKPTVPNDLKDPPRFGQPVETTKDACVIELQNFFNRKNITNSRMEEIPTIRKFDLSTNPRESSLETATKLIQKFPSIAENLPLVAILGATGRNFPMGIGTQFIHSVAGRTSVLGSLQQPFSLVDGQTLTYQTTTASGDVRQSTIIFRTSRFNNISAASAQEVVDEINFQSLYATASAEVTSPTATKISIGFGGQLDTSLSGDIKILGGTAASALGFTVNQQSLYLNTVPYNRYHQSTYIDIAVEVVSQSYTERTELTDLVWGFFTFYMIERQSTFFGRSIFSAIPNETYQVIIKPDPSMSGEAEVPRPNDETNKLYIKRINIPMITIQYIDRAVTVPTSPNTPLYINADNVQQDITLPPKN